MAALIIGSLPVDELLVKGNAGLNLEDSSGLVSAIDGMEFKLSGNGAAPPAVGLSVGVGLVKRRVLPSYLMF